MKHVPMIVVGAGVAGLAAAAEASAAGVGVLLVDERPGPGGALAGPMPAREDAGHDWLLPPVSSPSRAELVERLVAACAAGGVESHYEAFVWGVFREQRWLVAVRQQRRTRVFTADALILATGAYVTPDPLATPMEPGVLTPAAFYRQLLPGGSGCRSIILYGRNRIARALRRLAEERGLEVVAVLPARSSYRLVTASAQGVRLQNLSGKIVAADALVVTEPLTAAYELAALAGCSLHFAGEEGGFRPAVGEDWAIGDRVYAGGALLGYADADRAAISGRIAALAAVRDLAERPAASVLGRLEALRGQLRAAGPDGWQAFGGGAEAAPARRPRGARTHYAAFALEPDGRIVCPCTGVTKGEIVAAARAGARTIDDLKRRTGFAAGACQGRCCTRVALRAFELVHAARDSRLPFAAETAGPMRVRPPIRPLPLGELTGLEPEGVTRDVEASPTL